MVSIRQGSAVGLAAKERKISLKFEYNSDAPNTDVHKCEVKAGVSGRVSCKKKNIRYSGDTPDVYVHGREEVAEDGDAGLDVAAKVLGTFHGSRLHSWKSSIENIDLGCLEE